MLRLTVGHSLAGLRRLAWGSDPVLLLGREGRWRWPWALVGVAATVLVLCAFILTAYAFEALAFRRGWINSKFINEVVSSTTVLPFDPARPLSYAYELIWLPLLLAPLIVLRIVHGVSWRRAFSYRGGYRWRDFGHAAMAWLLVLCVLAALTYAFEPEQHQLRVPGLAIVPWIGLGLGAILMQTLAEDVFFLGYLHRTWGAVLPLRLPMAVALTTVFLLAHLPNEDVQRDILLGVLHFAIMTPISIAMLLRTQSLAAAAGLHWANNAFILLCPGAPEQVTPLALVVYTVPVYATGGSRALNALAYAGVIGGAALLLVLLLWRRSPLYLAQAPVPVAADIGGVPCRSR